MNEQDKKFIERSRKLLDQSSDKLDSATRTALTRIRSRALDRSRVYPRWLTWGAAPLTCLALVVALSFIWSPPTTMLQRSFVSDLGLLAAEDSIEFYEEIDFCLWLSEESDETSDFFDAADLSAAQSSAAWTSPGSSTDYGTGEPAGIGTIGISWHFRGPGHGLDRPLRKAAWG